MISHALTIVMNELNKHLGDVYNDQDSVSLGNMSDLFGTGSGGGLSRDKLYLSAVNVKEEKTLKNVPNYVRNDVTLTASYENPPVFLNFLILMTATHTDYVNGLSVLSRAIRFFQFKNVLTQDNVDPSSITSSSVPINPLDRLETFKLIFDLYSPTLEEVNHLWGTLGGKQYPFVLYVMRMLDLKFQFVEQENPLIQEIVRNIHHKPAVTP
uniref:Pvc16 N-terminal domain-containing protein n=1 Tax=Geobacter sp. (strain M21) TaxID=443144 RepID=C6E5Y3_GEOSM